MEGWGGSLYVKGMKELWKETNNKVRNGGQASCGSFHFGRVRACVGGCCEGLLFGAHGRVCGARPAREMLITQFPIGWGEPACGADRGGSRRRGSARTRTMAAASSDTQMSGKEKESGFQSVHARRVARRRVLWCWRVARRRAVKAAGTAFGESALLPRVCPPRHPLSGEKGSRAPIIEW